MVSRLVQAMLLLIFFTENPQSVNILKVILIEICNLTLQEHNQPVEIFPLGGTEAMNPWKTLHMHY